MYKKKIRKLKQCKNCGSTVTYFLIDGHSCRNCHYNTPKLGVYGWLSIALLCALMIPLVNAVDQYSNDTTMTISLFCIRDNLQCIAPNCIISIDNGVSSAMILSGDFLNYTLDPLTPIGTYKSLIYCEDTGLNFSMYYEFDVKQNKQAVEFMNIKDGSTLDLILFVCFAVLCLAMIVIGAYFNVAAFTVISSIFMFMLGMSIFNYYILFSVAMMILAVMAFLYGIALMFNR